MASQPPSGYRWGLRAVIALQCLLIFAFVYQGLSAPGPFGPRLPAVQGETLWLESHGALHQFDANGRRQQQISLHDLKISDNPTSLQFTQAHVFWVHDESRVHRCDLQKRQCLPVELAELDTRRSYRWVRVSDDESEIVVSDASQHRILVYRRDGITARYNLARTEAEGLRFPNQTLQVGNSMWVANTNRHQIMQLPGPGDVSARQQNTITHRDLRPGRSFPFAMAQDPRGQLWVLVAGPNMQNADLLIMNPRLQPERVVPLAPKQDPNAIALFQQHMLLTDMTNFHVRRLDLYGRVLGPFGDASFQAELDAARNKAQWSLRLPRLLISSIGVLMLIAVWLAWKAGELRQLRGTAWRAPLEDIPRDEVAPTPAPATTTTAVKGAAATPFADAALPIPLGRVTMVKALPGSTRTRRRLLLVVDAIALVAVGAMLYWIWPQFYQHDCAPGKACPAWLPYALSVLALLPLAMSWPARRKLKALEGIRIGTDGEQVQARVGNKRYHAPAHQVTCTRQQLLIGLGVVPLRLNGEALFDEALLRRDFIDRLPQMQMHNSPWSTGLLGHWWKHGGWQGRTLVIGFSAMCVLLAWVLVLRDLSTWLTTLL